MMKIAAFFFAGLFAVGAIVQWNDPDPLRWILAYAAAAGLSLAAALGHRLFVANALATVVFAIWFVSIASSLMDAPQEAFTSFKMRATSHEKPREAGGLGLLTGWSAFLAFRARPASSDSVD